MSGTDLYIIAEAAQGYEGSAELARLLVRGAAAGRASAVKFQIVYASDLCEPGYKYYDLFRKLELSVDQWRDVREEARRLKLDFIADVFGPRSLEVANAIGVDGCKLHSTTFYDDELTKAVLKMPGRLYVSIGGIEPEEVDAFLARHKLAQRSNVTMMYGFQAEPTPVEANNLQRIPHWQKRSGLAVGFMDHSDGAGPHTLTLSAMALAFGVRTFEKHITLDRTLELEDYVSALAPADFATYVKALRDLDGAVGPGTLTLTADEQAYRGRALKRVVAARDLGKGATLTSADVRLSRPAVAEGAFNPAEVVGRRLKRAVSAMEPIGAEVLE